ncbi:MAG: hypothetical protein EOP62_11695 [Sphingomonadales bacterium]|nr:MAG: hypothetical protein EOP62_11695 [Sphingomonadales bacterium]
MTALSLVPEDGHLKLRYGDLLQLLERMHALPRSRAIATESRIKNFSRLGFPNGPRVGSGERADYGADQIVQLLVAFELLRHRLPPAVISEIVRTEWPAIAAAFATAARTLGDDPRGDPATRPVLVVDTAALHEAGKTVRRGELLSAIEVVGADLVLGAKGAGWRSILLIDPGALLADAAALTPGLKRSLAGDDFIAAVSTLGEVDAAAGDGWLEGGYSRRRALADALAVLRALPPTSDEHESRMSPGTAGRLANAMTAEGSPLSLVSVGAWKLDAALVVYLQWIDAAGDRSARKPTSAEILTIKTAAQTPQRLHEAMVDAILGEIGVPVQDV